MTNPPTPRTRPTIERLLERVIFASRWLLAPLYVGLIAGLLVLLVQFVELVIQLGQSALTVDSDTAIVSVLGLVDLALTGGLMVMVMLAGYEIFISTLDLPGDGDKPEWMGHVDFGELKLKLLGSIVAIAAIHVLESFMNIEHLSDRELAWSVGILIAFVTTALLLAVMDRVSGGARD